MSGPDAGEDEIGTSLGETAPDAVAPEEWMRRDDEFLLAEDRAYVLRERRSWRSWVSPVLFGVGLALLVGDAIAVGVAAAIGLGSFSVVAPLLAEVGLGGLVVLKAALASVLVLVPSVTDDVRQTIRAGAVAAVAIGLVVVVSNAWAVLTMA